MVSGIQEVLVGYRHDAQVGPVVTVAPGGVLVGLYTDKAVRLAPVTRDIAMAMIEEVIGLAPLRGHRNRQQAMSPRLADIIVAMSELATPQRGCTLTRQRSIQSSSGQAGAVAVDGLVRVRGAPTPCRRGLEDTGMRHGLETPA